VDAVRIITTQTGAALLSRRLFDEKAWGRFCQVWPAMRAVHFDQEAIYFSEGLDDIRYEADNRCMAEKILMETQRAIEASDVLFASIAGGRKTMGYYLGLKFHHFSMGSIKQPFGEGH